MINRLSVYFYMYFLLDQDEAEKVCLVLVAAVTVHGKNALKDRKNTNASMEKIVAGSFSCVHQYTNFI